MSGQVFLPMAPSPRQQQLDRYNELLQINNLTSFWRDYDTSNADLTPSDATKKRSVTWDRHFAALLEYGKEHGHYNIPVRADYTCTLVGEGGVCFEYVGKLGKWLHDQRQAKKGHKSERLRPEREEQLQALVDQGKLLWDASMMNWRRQQDEMCWRRNFAALIEFRRIHGHVNIPANMDYECELPGGGTYTGRLGKWLHEQRALKKKRVPYRLTQDQERWYRKLVAEPMAEETNATTGSASGSTGGGSGGGAGIAASGMGGEDTYTSNAVSSTYLTESGLSQQGEFTDASDALSLSYSHPLTTHSTELGANMATQGMHSAPPLEGQLHASSSVPSSSTLQPELTVQSSDDGLYQHQDPMHFQTQNNLAHQVHHQQSLQQHQQQHQQQQQQSQYHQPKQQSQRAQQSTGNKRQRRATVVSPLHISANLASLDVALQRDLPSELSEQIQQALLDEQQQQQQLHAQSSQQQQVYAQPQPLVPPQRQPKPPRQHTSHSQQQQQQQQRRRQHEQMQSQSSGTPAQFPVVSRAALSKKSLAWQKHFTALVEYGKEHGHCNIPVRAEYTCDLPILSSDGTRMRYSGKLGKWLHDQRQAFKGNKKERLRADRANLMQALVDQGLLLWDAAVLHTRKEQDEAAWRRHFAALLEYGREYGHCNVPVLASYECMLPGMGPLGTPLQYAGKLGKWLTTQRQAKKGHGYQLAPDRERLLQDLVDQGTILIVSIIHIS